MSKGIFMPRPRRASFAPPRARRGLGEGKGMIRFRSRFRRRAAGLAAAWLLGFAPAPAGAEPVVVAPLPGFTHDERLTIPLAARADFTVFTLDDPPRVVIDLPALQPWEAPLRAAAGLRLFGNLRFGRDESGAGARLVIDLKRPARVARIHTEAAAAGARLVADLTATDAETFAALAGWPAEEQPAPLAAAPAPPKAEGALVVIDAGHGGADPGAITRGIAEKDIVLSYARALRAAIDARPGLRAFMVREGDEYLTLDQRLAIARRAGGDVFLSLHADALAAGEASGVSVYVLGRSASSRHAAALAHAHDRAEMLDGAALEAEESDVARVLIDLARRRTDQRSRALAALLVEALGDASPVLEGRGIQSAGFRVLTAPDIPSALIELGFMSSAEDRTRLLSADARDAVVAAIADAVAAWVAAERD